MRAPNPLCDKCETCSTDRRKLMPETIKLVLKKKLMEFSNVVLLNEHGIKSLSKYLYLYLYPYTHGIFSLRETSCIMNSSERRLIAENK